MVNGEWSIDNKQSAYARATAEKQAGLNLCVARLAF
jgi:hypothetical protein